MLKKYGDQQLIGASLGSATGGVPQNDRAFASLSIATQSAEYTTCANVDSVELSFVILPCTLTEFCLFH